MEAAINRTSYNSRVVAKHRTTGYVVWHKETKQIWPGGIFPSHAAAIQGFRQVTGMTRDRMLLAGWCTRHAHITVPIYFTDQTR